MSAVSITTDTELDVIPDGFDGESEDDDPEEDDR